MQPHFSCTWKNLKVDPPHCEFALVTARGRHLPQLRPGRFRVSQPLQITAHPPTSLQLGHHYEAALRSLDARSVGATLVSRNC